MVPALTPLAERMLRASRGVRDGVDQPACTRLRPCVFAACSALLARCTSASGDAVPGLKSAMPLLTFSPPRAVTRPVNGPRRACVCNLSASPAPCDLSS